jgi:hypothetical protein
MTAHSAATMTRLDTDAKAIEREKLLNEALAEHRAELKRQSSKLIEADKFKTAGKGLIYRIKAVEREMMLQILNDIRIGSWRMLGEPENLDLDISNLPKSKLRHYHFMQLAGFFEHHFLGPDFSADIAQ